MRYFEPLYEFLKEKNKQLIEEHEVRQLLEEYNEIGSKKCNGFVSAQWDTLTDLSSVEKQAAYVKAVSENAIFKKDQYNQWIKALTDKQFVDERIQRQIKLLSNLDTDILDDDSLSQLTNIVLKMVGIYNAAKVCPFENQSCDLSSQGMPLDPGEFNLFANDNTIR